MLKTVIIIKIPTITKLINKKSLEKEKIISMAEKLQESSMLLQKSLLNDILRQKDKDTISFSADTFKHKKELEEIIKGFEEVPPKLPREGL